MCVILWASLYEINKRIIIIIIIVVVVVVVVVATTITIKCIICFVLL